MRKFPGIVLMLLFSQVIRAGEATGHVASIYVADDSTAVLFRLDSPINKSPRCNESDRFSLNLRKRGGMAAYMALLEAKRENYVVSVEGLNRCANHWKSEDILNIQLK